MSAFTWPPEAPRSQAPEGGRAAEPIAAAVLAPIFLDGSSRAHVVLTRRRADLRRHAGEISFPGGRRDAGDADLQATALREAEEEIGLPREHVSLIGELPPVSTFATGYVIHPFVGSIPPGLAWELSAREVAAVLELPLEELAAARTRTRLERRGISFETDAYVLGEHLIWGATARILAHLLEQLVEQPGGGFALSGPAAADAPGTPAAPAARPDSRRPSGAP